MNGNQKDIKKLPTYLMIQLKDDITYIKRIIYKTSPPYTSNIDACTYNWCTKTYCCLTNFNLLFHIPKLFFASTNDTILDHEKRGNNNLR